MSNREARSSKPGRQEMAAPVPTGPQAVLHRYHLGSDRGIDYISTFDLKGQCHFVTDSVRQVLGYSPEQFQALQAAEIVHPDDQPRFAALMADIQEGRPAGPLRARVRHADGRYLWLEATIRRTDGSQAGFDPLLVITRDITDLIEAEENLARSNTRNRELLESLSDSFFALDEELRVTYMNRAAQEILGVETRDVIGRNLFDAFPAARQTIFEEKYTQALRDKEFLTFETWFGVEPLDDWYDVRVYPMDEGISVFFQVTTERHRAAEALRRSEKRYRELTEALPDAVLIEDAEGRIHYANAAAGRVMRLDREDLIGKTEFDTQDPEQAQRHIDAIRQVLRTGEPMVLEDAVQLPAGEMVFHTKILPLIDEELHRVLIVARDITDTRRDEQERLNLEKQIQQTQKLESLGVLAGGIAHDFNNLLVGILGNADLALDELSRVSPVRQYVEEIEQASRRAAELCRQMLAYSGKGRFVVEPVDLSEAVLEMGHMLEVSISKTAILKYNCAENLPAVEADVTQLRQVIMNLITNASEAIGSRSGIISITTGAMECGREYLDEVYIDEDLAEGTYVFLEVADTGSGMDETTRQRLFDPFYTTKFTGRGLGLAAVLGIVRGHSGAIKVYSEPGQGTTFKVLLPACEMDATGHEAGVGGSSDWRGHGTVLLADDDETVRTVSRRMLETLGFDVVCAGHGQQALELFDRHADQLACVLLDLTMPHMDGEEVFRRLRSRDGQVPVIMSSGYNEQEVSQRFLGKGLAGFIQKPYNLSTLTTVFREVLDSEQGAGPGDS
jgi:PAS domain S-box-containing protein